MKKVFLLLSVFGLLSFTTIGIGSVEELLPVNDCEQGCADAATTTGASQGWTFDEIADAYEDCSEQYCSDGPTPGGGGGPIE